jgi:hypothetical protein
MDLNLTTTSSYLTTFNNDNPSIATSSRATSRPIYTETSAVFHHLLTTQPKRRNDWGDYESIDFIPDVIWESLLSMLFILILLVVLCFICWRTQILQGKYMGYSITRSDVENL